MKIVSLNEKICPVTISEKTMLSSPQDIEFKKNRGSRMVENSVTRPVTPVLPIDTL